MLVSVVTPCLNPGGRLQRCLDSVRAQTHTEVEHIVVDGGSTDDTVGVLEKSGVRYVSEPDSGQTDAITKGMSLARGELLTWLNADDMLVPSAAERAVAAGSDWIYGDCRVVRGQRSSVWRPPRRYGNWQVEAGEMIPQPGCFFSRGALDRVGGLDASFDLTMDIDLWIRLVDAGYVSRYVPEVLAVFEIHPGSKTGAVGKKRFHLEHAHALAKSGRIEAASGAVGRAIALGGAGNEDVPVWADEKIVRASYLVEVGIESLRAHDASGARHLLSPGVLRVRESRRRLIASARRAIRIV
jgi:glycosyltransferase involved in cell wall biosynthesis